MSGGACGPFDDEREDEKRMRMKVRSVYYCRTLYYDDTVCLTGRGFIRVACLFEPPYMRLRISNAEFRNAEPRFSQPLYQ